MKPTHGLVPLVGIVPISPDFDSAGPIARCAADIAVMMDAMVDPKLANHIPNGTYTSQLTGSFTGIRIGVLDPTQWHLDDAIALPNKSFDDQVVSSAQEPDMYLLVVQTEQSANPHPRTKRFYRRTTSSDPSDSPSRK